MASVRPIVRHLIPCEDFLIPPNHPHKISLLNLIFSIRSMEDPPFPTVQEEFCIFVVLTNGRGTGQAFLKIVHADSDQAVRITQMVSVNFGNDPLKVLGIPFRIRNCTFPQPGLYWIQLWYDNMQIGEQDILLR